MNFLAALLFGLGIVAIQVLNGGAGNSAYAMPGYLLIVAGGVAAAVGGIRTDGGAKIGIVFLAAALFGYLYWRAGESPDGLAGQRTLGLIVASGILWFAFAGILTSTLSRWIFVSVLVAGILGNLVLGVMQVMIDWDRYALYFAAEEYRDLYVTKFEGRMIGTYLNPNHLAWILNVAAMFCLAIGLWARVRVWVRVLTIYLGACFVVGTVLTGSRGAMIALAVALLAFAMASLIVMTSNATNRRAWLSLSVVAGVCVVLAGGYFAYSTNWQIQGRIDSLSVKDVRAVLNEYGWRQFQQEPLLGSGTGMFVYESRAMRRNQFDDAIYVHNDWLQIAVEYGWVGFSLVLLLVGVLLWQGMAMFSARIRRSQESIGSVFESGAALLIGAWAALIAMSVHSLFDFNMYTPANALLAAIVAGMLGMVSIGGKNRWADVSAVLGRGLCVALVFGGAIALAFWLRQQAVPEYRLHQARLAMNRENFGRAIEESKLGLAASPQHAELLFMLGSALETPNIMADEMVSLTIDDDGEDGDEQLDALRREALAAYQGAIEQRPMERRNLIAAGEVLTSLGKREEAREVLRSAVKFEPNHGYVFGAIGDYYETLGELDEAFKWYRVGASLPGWEYSSEQLEFVTERIKRRDEAAGAGVVP